MKYYVQFVSNGALQVNQITEWGNVDSAKAKYHDVCKTLWNAQDVVRATVAILDSEFNVVDDYREIITHAQAQPEQAQGE